MINEKYVSKNFEFFCCIEHTIRAKMKIDDYLKKDLCHTQSDAVSRNGLEKIISCTFVFSP